MSSSKERAPKGCGAEHKVVELVDLGGPVARIERVKYVYNNWTTVTLMSPRTGDDPGGSLVFSMKADELKRFVEALKWPE